jgi:ring-1,2-phenylacetyl-CoA epoxidase subunit PaaC
MTNTTTERETVRERGEIKTSIDYLLHLADTTLILGQKNAEWCGHGPILEQDIAITNITLDLVGQARMYYQYAANMMLKQEGKEETEDSLAFLRNEREFKNLLICELPNGDWAQTVLRQFLFSVFQQSLLRKLSEGADEELAAIANKSLKEVNYHVKWSSEWVIRLGDGTEESHARMKKAIENLWMYVGEFFKPAVYEPSFVTEMETEWRSEIETVFTEAGLIIPENVFMQEGGKTGHHTEYMGYILSEMQTLQRNYPGASW